MMKYAVIWNEKTEQGHVTCREERFDTKEDASKYRDLAFQLKGVDAIVMKLEQPNG